MGLIECSIMISAVAGLINRNLKQAHTSEARPFVSFHNPLDFISSQASADVFPQEGFTVDKICEDLALHSSISSPWKKETFISGSKPPISQLCEVFDLIEKKFEDFSGGSKEFMAS